MKNTKHGFAGLAILGVMVSLVMSTTAFADEVDPVATSWSEESGADISVSAAGDLTVTFSARGQMSPRDTYDFIVGGALPASAFAGDLSQYTGIRFRLAGDGEQPAGVKMSIYSTDIYTDNMRHWEHGDAKGSSEPYEWMINKIPLAHPLNTNVWNAIWDYDKSPYRFPPERNWEQDLSAVDMIVLSITPSSSGNEQTYSVSQFQLVSDEGMTEPAQLTPLAACFEGVTNVADLTSAQIDQDSDGDGMTDLDEIAAGMDPHSSASVFDASMEMTQGGNVIRWNGVFGAHYAVLRSTDLTKGFKIIAPDEAATVTGPKTYTDTDPVEGQPNFYKIVKY